MIVKQLLSEGAQVDLNAKSRLESNNHARRPSRGMRCLEDDRKLRIHSVIDDGVAPSCDKKLVAIGDVATRDIHNVLRARGARSTSAGTIQQQECGCRSRDDQHDPQSQQSKSK
ncbi:hypothetical protein [Bradyrhizobium sp. AUGA SZCCT0160]|uniref:hypothetical protein n=1 Tax=Bradyrhizobium sp. AUGA SZCCT0160 TaxID=2807662 RepID=UPI001BA73ED5|nr:hypothetical protein [Bradyrhizobium sp. AUGA SZCCT0160]MBR1190393.1 hypothetical protein [Bradyrhizobium sp. AUGA SZCCT0160]